VGSFVGGLANSLDHHKLVLRRVPNGLRKTGQDQLVQSKVKSSPMVEIRSTEQSWWLELTRPGSVGLGGLGKNRVIEGASA